MDEALWPDFLRWSNYKIAFTWVFLRLLSDQAQGDLKKALAKALENSAVYCVLKNLSPETRLTEVSGK